MIRGPAGIALLAGSLAAALRLPFVHDVPYADEGGLLVVASHWRTGGPFLYGPFFVDRPPVLLLFFRLGSALGGVAAVRLLGLGLVFTAVAVAARSGWRLGSARGSAAAAVVCAALLADPLLGTREVDAETVGVPFVLLTAMLTLEALHLDPGRTRLILLGAAGCAGGTALLVKQNLADGLVFAGVLAASEAIRRRTQTKQSLAELATWGLGAAVPLGAAAVWSAWSTGPRGLWFAAYGFRIAAGADLFATTSSSQQVRLTGLLEAALLSGLAAVLVAALAQLLRRRPTPLVVALASMLLTELVGAAGGGYYWPHYLIALVPATALLAGLAAGVVVRPLVLSAVIAATALSTLVQVVAVGSDPARATHTEVGALAAWLGRAARPGDSAAVLYGDASVFAATRLHPAYPFLWSLPQRVLDPRLRQLVDVLDDRGGPTFVVVRMPLDSWGQDPRGHVAQALTTHYRLVALVAGDTVYRRVPTARVPQPP